MIVYRVENNDGHGPWYNQNFDCFDLKWESPYDQENQYPCSANDPKINCQLNVIERQFKDKIIHGAHTIELIMHWFYNCSELMLQHGFDIHVYDVPDEYVIIGKYQTIFAKSHAKKIK